MSEPLRELPVENEIVESAPLPMAWHRAQANWLAWLLAAWNIYQAVWIALGKIYYNPDLTRALYAGLPAMRIIDYALAALLLAGALLLVCACGQLKKFKPKGIRLLVWAYMLLAAAWVAYAAARFFAAGLSPFSIPVIGRCAGFFALGLVNRSYYRKRQSLFSKRVDG